ncbi:MAG: TatD family hydrolase [Bacteroidetes bacterium]|nr:TatD family hydrolase [Bacteroidota bacterium]
MYFIDTHSHIYQPDFDEDRTEAMQRAFQNNIQQILLPNIDCETIPRVLQLVEQFPHQAFGMLGLHPSHVKENWEEELRALLELKDRSKWVAIGEIGMDLYWDKTYIEEQKQAFRLQIQWAKDWKLPIVIHAREAFQEIFEILDEVMDERLSGVFHCFTGGKEEVEHILNYPNFYFGIGGVATYKKAALDEVIQMIPSEKLILETDAPYLSPVPFRGKRNESSYLIHTAEKVADVLNIKLSELAELTTRNAQKLFELPTFTQST